MTAVIHVQLHVLIYIVILVMVAVCGGCDPDNCLNDKCDTDTVKCTDGCKIGLRRDYCDKGKFTNRY